MSPSSPESLLKVNDPKVLSSILACPQCSGTLSPLDSGYWACSECELAYPGREKGIHLQKQAGIAYDPRTGLVQKGAVAFFEVIKGVNQGLSFRLYDGTFCILGRSPNSTNSNNWDKTEIHDTLLRRSLGETARKLADSFLLQIRAGKNISYAGWDAIHRQPDVFLDDDLVSRQHLLLMYLGGQAHALDLLSRNGSFVQGKEIERITLESNNIIKTGRSEISFSLR